MITVKKLFTLEPKHRYRKACQILELIEANLRIMLENTRAKVDQTQLRDRPLSHLSHDGNAPTQQPCQNGNQFGQIEQIGGQIGQIGGQIRDRPVNNFDIHASMSIVMPQADTILDEKLHLLSEILQWLKDFSSNCLLNPALPEHVQRESIIKIIEQLHEYVTNLSAETLTIIKENEGHTKGLDPTNFEALIRLINTSRHSIENLYGKASADWDFFAPLGVFSQNRSFFPGMRVFLEDIRSPYNVGSIFRTADACGFEEVLLSGFTADPQHARAQRTAMGAHIVVPWRRISLQELAHEEHVILGLELGGTSIDSYTFPTKGTLLLGSEELGLSPEAKAICTDIISIPMLGAKGSLNVSVAFGIVANAWRLSLQMQGILPVQSR